MYVTRWLKSDKALVQLVALWFICAVLFTIAWTFSYDLLPEGILRGRLLAGRIPGSPQYLLGK